MNKNRRSFLKLLFLGGGALLLVKLFGSRLQDLFSGRVEKTLGDFRTTEDKKSLVVYDRTGAEVLIIDKEQ